MLPGGSRSVHLNSVCETLAFASHLLITSEYPPARTTNLKRQSLPFVMPVVLPRRIETKTRHKERITKVARSLNAVPSVLVKEEPFGLCLPNYAIRQGFTTSANS